MSLKLKINDTFIGLREVENNIYEPKNLNVLKNTLDANLATTAPVTVLTYFHNNSKDVVASLNKIQNEMIGYRWNLIVIDNGSTDDTYDYISDFKSSAANYLHMSVNRVYDRDEFTKLCLNYADEYLQSGELFKLVKNTDVHFSGDSLSSFCFMATKNVAKEALLLVYSIRCYHREPIYIVCDRETEEYIMNRIECYNIFFERSATEENLAKIREENKEVFERLDNSVHRLDCIYQKMRAIDFALESEPNTLFLDSDIVIVDKITDTFHKKLVMSPHYWGVHKKYGIYNAGYVYCADKDFVKYWRDMYLTRSTFCEQEATNYFAERYDLDVFGPEHNHGFWRNNYQLPTYKSFHCHIFGLQDRADTTSVKQNTHRQFILDFLNNSSSKEHEAIYNTINLILTDDFTGKLPPVEGQYCHDWASAKLPAPVKSNTTGKINLNTQTIFHSHRSGWSYAMSALAPLHNESGVVFDGFLENNFAWTDPRVRQTYLEPWIGFFHNPGNTPDWFFGQFSIENIIETKQFQDSLQACQGLFALSKDHADYINRITGKTVSVLYHPTEIPDMLFNYDSFLENKHKKVINIGYWLRKLNSIYRLPVNGEFEKWRLIPYTTTRPKDTIDKLLYHERELYNYEPTEYFDNTRTVERVSNYTYDKLLSQNIVFLDLYNSSANNAIIECIARATPIAVNPIPAVVEYLGPDYPFYFNDLDEASEKIRDFDLIKAAHIYLLDCGTRKMMSKEYFRKSFEQSEVYQSL